MNTSGYQTKTFKGDLRATNTGGVPAPRASDPAPAPDSATARGAPSFDPEIPLGAASNHAAHRADRAAYAARVEFDLRIALDRVVRALRELDRLNHSGAARVRGEIAARTASPFPHPRSVPSTGE